MFVFKLSGIQKLFKDYKMKRHIETLRRNTTIFLITPSFYTTETESEYSFGVYILYCILLSNLSVVKIVTKLLRQKISNL